METALQRLWVTLLAVVCLVACGSSELMIDDEAMMWVAVYSPERIDIDATICIQICRRQCNLFRLTDGWRCFPIG